MPSLFSLSLLSLLMSPHPPKKSKRMSESNRKNRTTTSETTVNQAVEFGNGGTLPIHRLSLHSRYRKAASFANQLQHTHLIGEFHTHLNGHFRNLNWRFLPYIRPIFQGYVRGYTPKICLIYGTVAPF